MKEFLSALCAAAGIVFLGWALFAATADIAAHWMKRYLKVRGPATYNVYVKYAKPGEE